MFQLLCTLPVAQNTCNFAPTDRVQTSADVQYVMLQTCLRCYTLHMQEFPTLLPFSAGGGGLTPGDPRVKKPHASQKVGQRTWW